MTIVVDASVVVAALVDSGSSGKWSEEIIAQDGLIAPELLLVETTNVLRRLERTSAISHSEAAAAQRDLLRLDMQYLPFLPVADQVWKLRHNYTSYDATYIAIAETFAAPLATLDVRLSQQKATCQFLTPTDR